MMTEKKRTLLVVDDDDTFRDLLKRRLESRNYIVWDAPDGDVAMELAEEHNPDLVILDYMLPNKTGDRVAKELGNRCPYIFLSGIDTAILAEVDFNGVLMHKPLDFAELILNIERLVLESSEKSA